MVDSNISDRVLARLAGRIWIDAAEHIIMRLEALSVREANAETSTFSPESNVPVEFEYMRLPNGTWVTSLIHVNTHGRNDIFEGDRFELTLRYRDFRLFSTNVEIERLNVPQT